MSRTDVMPNSRAYPQKQASGEILGETPWNVPQMSPIEGLVRNALHTRIQPWTVVIGGVPCQLRAPLYGLARESEQGQTSGIKPLDSVAFCIILHLGAERWLVEVGQGFPLTLHPAIADVPDERALPQALRHAVLELLVTPLVEAFGNFMDMRITCEVVGVHGDSDEDTHADGRASAIKDLMKEATCALPFTLTVPAKHGQSGSEQLRVVPLIVHMTGQATSHFYQKINTLPPHIHDMAGLAVPVSIEAGSMVLTAAECANLQLDDIVLPESYPAKDGRIALRMSQCVMPCVLAGGNATVEAIVPLESPMQSASPSDSPFGSPLSTQGENSMTSEQENASATQAGVDNVHIAGLEVTLTFELERRTMTLGELSMIAPGYTFALGVDALAPVTLRIGDKFFGTGRLVDLNGTMGVQLTSLADNATVKKPVETTAVGPMGTDSVEPDLVDSVSTESGSAEPYAVRGLASFAQAQTDDASQAESTTPSGPMSGDYA